MPDYSIDPSDLVPDTNAAQILRLKPATLAAWRAQRRGPPFIRLGRAIFYWRRDLIDYITANRHEPAA
jgi:hypothetical protein